MLLARGGVGRSGPEVSSEPDFLVGNGTALFFGLDRNLDLGREGSSSERGRILRGRPRATLSQELPRREADPACTPLRGFVGLQRVPSEWPFGFGPCSRPGVDEPRKADSLYLPRSDGATERRRKRTRSRARKRVVQSAPVAYVGSNKHPRPPHGRTSPASGPTDYRVRRRHVAGFGERQNVAGRRRSPASE